MKNQLKEKIVSILEKEIPQIKNIEENIKIEVPKEEKFGDFSINAAFLLSKHLKKKPVDIAHNIKETLEKEEIFEKVEVAGAGFVNLFLSVKFFKEFLHRAVVSGDRYGEVQNKEKGKINVEFVSANPTGPLHLGHGRGAVVGNTLSNILNYSGYQVEREFYINDAGNQIKKLGESIYARFRQIEEPDYPFPEDGYHGEYIKEIAKEIYYSEREKVLKFLNEEEAIEWMSQYGKNILLEKIKKDLKLINVEFDIWFSEKELYQQGKVQEAIEFLEDRGLIYEKDGALWLKTTEYGDDKDRVIKKSDGTYTYFAGDIAYHYDKLKRGYDKAINVWGADHHGYFPRLKAATLAMGASPDWLEVVLIQLVKLFKEGQEVKMSKRAGEFITLRDLVEEVGADAVIYFFLSRDSNTHLNFDIDIATKQSSENPIFYIQYAHARISSVFKEAKERLGIDVLNIDEENTDLSILNEKIEKELMKMIATLPEEIYNIADQRQPHKITNLAYDLASKFHYYYNNFKFLNENDEKLTRGRIYLLRAIKNSLRTLLKLMGIVPRERM